LIKFKLYRNILAICSQNALLLLALCLYPFILLGKPLTSGRQVIGFNDQWTFSKDKQSWQEITIPHTWNAKDVIDDGPGYYRGTGWYKRVLKGSPLMKGKALFLCFDGVNQEAEVYVNGKLAGRHVGGYTRFTVPITGLLNLSADFKNEVLVQVTNRFNEDIPPLTADFTFFGGIYRRINLLVTESVHFATADHGTKGVYISTPSVSAEQATVKVNSLLENAAITAQILQVKTTVYNRQGKPVAEHILKVNLKPGEKKAISQNLPAIDKPDLWSPKNPVLYRVVSSIIDAKSETVVDQVANSLGFRWYKFDAEKGFFLNGEALKLMGASRHQDYEGLGNAVPEALQIKDVELLKAMGGNFLRVAHYPQDPVILESCDRLGILASVEIPIVNAITEREAFTENCKNMQVEMIRQNYNHPSVIIWAYMNEVLLRPKFENDKTRQQQYFNRIRDLAQLLEELTRKTDSSRYTMMSLHGDFDKYQKTGLTKIPMLIGWNLYQGWYGGELKGFGQFLDKHHRELPDKPILITEFGADADPRIRSFLPVRFDKSVEYAINFSQVYLNDILSRPFVSGAMVWNLADFNSETREETMPHINNKGLLTLGREKKDTYYLYQAYLLDRPFIKIASRNWKERTGIADSVGVSCTQPVQVATNLEEVELFLNGKSLGRQKSKDRVCEWLVPFMAGLNQLRAIDPQGPAISDQMIVDFTLIPYRFSDTNDFQTMYVLLGAKRYFMDETQQTLWIPDQPYRKGSFGYIGGTAFIGGNNRMSYGSDKNILNTVLDPVYQTQQVDLKAYKMDVPDGEYELSLFFAELMGGPSKEALVYNLDSQVVKEGIADQRRFNLKINGRDFLENFSISEEYGYAVAAQKTTKVYVSDGRGITLDFTSIQGKPVLNALSLRKLN
jgi:beta-galactosidase